MKENPGKLSGNIALFLKNRSKSENYTIDIIDTKYKRGASTIVQTRQDQRKLKYSISPETLTGTI